MFHRLNMLARGLQYWDLTDLVISPEFKLKFDSLFQAFESPEFRHELPPVDRSAITHQSPFSCSSAGSPKNSSIASSGLSAFTCLAL